MSSFDWTNFASGVVGAVAALGGVMITQRSERKKAREDRIWQPRMDIYVIVYRWAVSQVNVQHVPDLDADPSGETEKLVGPAFPSSDDELNVSLYGSDAVTKAFWECRLAWTDDSYRFPKSTGEAVAQKQRFLGTILSNVILSETHFSRRPRYRRFATRQAPLRVKLPFSRRTLGW